MDNRGKAFRYKNWNTFLKHTTNTCTHPKLSGHVGIWKTQKPLLFGKHLSPLCNNYHGNQTHLLLILLLHGNRAHSTCSAPQPANSTWQSLVCASVLSPSLNTLACGFQSTAKFINMEKSGRWGPPHSDKDFFPLEALCLIQGRAFITLQHKVSVHIQWFL